MVDTVKTTTTTTTDQDDWEVAVDTGEFDKRLEQQEKDRAATQESIPSIQSEEDNRLNLMKSNKPIRILKRPTSQTQLPVNHEMNNSNTTTATISSTNLNSPFANEISSSTIVPNISIIPRNQSKDSNTFSQTINTSNSLSSKPPIKTYEQREAEYRLARLRIMGEEESSAKDDDDDNPPIEPPSNTSDDTSRITFTEPSLQSHSTPGSYASNLYTLNNTSVNTAAIHFTPTTNTTGPYSQPQYRGIYPSPYPLMPIIPPTSTRYPVYIPASSNYPVQPLSNSWYHYQQQQQAQQQTPYGTQQYGPPQ